MKTALSILLLSLLAAGAQTNIVISFTNSSGIFITNATVVKLMPNKLIYRTDAGGGVARLDTLPGDVQAKLGYDPVRSEAADIADNSKKQKADALFQKQKESAIKQAQWEEAKRIVLQKGVRMTCSVIQKISDGLLVSWPGNSVEPYESSVTVLLVDYPRYASTASEDNLFIDRVYPLGLYTYTTVNKSDKTIRRWTCDISKAIQAELDAVAK